VINSDASIDLGVFAWRRQHKHQGSKSHQNVTSAWSPSRFQPQIRLESRLPEDLSHQNFAREFDHHWEFVYVVLADDNMDLVLRKATVGSCAENSTRCDRRFGIKPERELIYNAYGSLQFFGSKIKQLSGCKVRESDCGKPWNGISCSSTYPSFPISLPPYKAESLFISSR
jgi:hypothetical protein